MKIRGSLVRLKKIFFGRRTSGYTLVEAAAVIGITSVLSVTVALPTAIDNLNRGRLTAAEGVVRGIGTAMVSFFSDADEWPDRRSDTEDDFYEILRSGTEPGDEAKDPFADADKKILITDDAQDWAPLAGGKERIGNLNEHLKSGRVPPPNVLTTDPTLLPLTYEKWFGPYLDEVDQDPWGKNYLVYVRALTKDKNNEGRQLYAWVISAGPDNILTTRPTDVKSIDDDIGVLMVKKEKR